MASREVYKSLAIAEGEKAALEKLLAKTKVSVEWEGVLMVVPSLAGLCY